jgi:hypothetical protein
VLASVDRWGDYPAWLAAIGTIVAVVVALGLAGRESRQRRHEDERRQAELITAWLETVGDMTTAGLVMPVVAIVNGSQQLAYRVIASLVPVRGAITEDFREVSGAGAWEFRVFKGELPLGRTNLEIKQPGGGMHIRFAVELAFRDAAGRSWVRTTQGELKRIRSEPADHYGIHEPIDW